MSTLYDDIMSLLHEAGAFAENGKEKGVARSVRNARQIAETEFLWDPAKRLPVKRSANLAARHGNSSQWLEASR
ncbi:hypothetical protein [Antarctobacter sp.]|uniref:hypothetical protein n=1 Tax=Antarctobacter sp. TaxID=1872577 RepID=UPI002B26E51B|nr:hypothetical protein [Antarctobacter sp.]